jgi:hypothetical protein
MEASIRLHGIPKTVINYENLIFIIPGHLLQSAFSMAGSDLQARYNALLKVIKSYAVHAK